ncbi:putative transcriptional regulator [Lactobacillus phage LpeD]|uniref:Putative transcriptional regulator n=1 Tax=Lactobacillus phage LpeD TaxID=2041210 RepID=A0A291I9H4_9CAUD|nr:HTH DNA binding protein [Lactobacillus phage LpeD]ATG86341.1 putative transcriptional regulator [Lactobacillus phage LpeD]
MEVTYSLYNCDLGPKLQVFLDKVAEGAMVNQNKVMARFQKKELATKVGKSAKTIKRYLDKLEDFGILLVKSIYGKNGGIEVYFDEDMIKFKNRDKLVSKISKPVLKPEINEDKNLYLKRNNYNYDAFKEIGEGTIGFNAYVLSRLYDKYAQLFKNEDAKEKKLNLVFEFSDSLGGHLIGNGRYTSFKKLAKFIMTNGINPVYYMSSVFSRFKFVSRLKRRCMSVPFINSFNSEEFYGYYNNQVDYDTKFYSHVPNDNTHQTVEFDDDAFISFVYQYFQLMIQSGYNQDLAIKSLREFSYKESATVIDDVNNLYESKEAKDYIHKASKIVGSFQDSSNDNSVSLYLLQSLYVKIKGFKHTPLILFGTSFYNTHILSELLNNEDYAYLHSMLFGYSLTQKAIYKALLNNLPYNSAMLENLISVDSYGISDFCEIGKIISTFVSSDLVNYKDFNFVKKQCSYEIPLDNYGMITTVDV